MPTTQEHVKALELANTQGGDPAAVVARAHEYHAFLIGSTAGAKAANKTADSKATAASGTPTKAAAAPTNKAPVNKAPANKAPAQPAKAPGGKHTADDVRNVLRQLVQQDKDLALKIVNEAGGGAAKFSEVKPEFYDALYDGITAELTNGDSGGSDDDIV